MQIIRSMVIAICIVTAGCAGTQFNWADAEKIETGMTEAEVVAILGEPYSKLKTANQTVLTWSYSSAFSPAKAVSFSFVDGVVVAESTVNK